MRIAGLPSNDLPPEGRWRGGPSALKSALQKAVRLGRGSCAVRAALHLFKEDGGAAQLLRRLSIVCVEDAILHPGLPFVVWLMAAQAKGFVLGRTHLDALLCLVYQLAMVQVRDGLPDPWDGGDSATVGTPVDATSQGPVTLQQVDELALPAAETCLVKCLLFRASYGGMGGDVRMMKIFAGYWAARFKGSAAPPPLLTVPPPSPGHQCRPWSDSTTAVLSSSPGVATRAQPRGPVASGPNRPYPGLGPLTEPLPQAPCAAGPTANTEGTEQLPAGRNRAIAVVVQPGPQPLERAPGPNLGTKNTSPGTRDVAAAGACKRAATQAFGGAESTPNCKSHGVLAGESFASPGDGPCQPSLAPGLQSQQLRRRSGAGPTSGGTQADWAGASQLSPADLRVSDAYFAARLQAEDAPPSCGVFVPASQLLAEAVNEQRSLQRMAATAPRQQLHSQAQQWPPYHLQAYPQASTHSWNVADAANASDGNCRSSHGHMGGGDGLTGSAWYGHASQASQGTFASETPAACAFSIGKFPSLTQLQLQQQQDVVLPKWHSRYAGGCTAAAAAAKVGATCGDGGSDGVSGADYVVPTDGDKGECSAWLTYLCSLYDQVTVPVALAMTSSVGPMRRSDVPLSAVDFHISDIVTRLMERSEVVALAPGGSAEHAGTPEDTEDALKSAMWLFRSSKNSKVWVHRLSPCCQHLHASGGAAAGTRGGACAEHRSLEAQFEREESSRRRLAALWSAAAPWADRFSVSYIARRFGPP
ncbi:hypothetical protein Vafri_11102 [Volvox africanus]|uniref:Uncharacterized protein n=1 Tax=Volvox africanus TaxID=51714 RepID=A0A8J4B716_9CHLO|nr:hypothetical protein Vafri_11102 [Volvox africanus]